MNGKTAIDRLQEMLDGKLPPTGRKSRRRVAREVRKRAGKPAADECGRAQRRRRRQRDQ